MSFRDGTLYGEFGARSWRDATWASVTDGEAVVAWDRMEQAGQVTWQPTLTIRHGILWAGDVESHQRNRMDTRHTRCRCLQWNGLAWVRPRAEAKAKTEPRWIEIERSRVPT